MTETGSRRRPLRGPVALFAAAILVIAACSGNVGAAPSSAGPAPRGHGCPTSEPAPLPAGQTRTVVLQTAKGPITIRVDANLAPIATGNFVALASCGFYDATVFHRVVPGFVIQGGDPTGTGAGGPGYTITDEPVTTPYQRGTVAMARGSRAHSQGSQFFIVLDDSAAESLTQTNNYAILGTVTSGMDVADAIAAAADREIPTNPIPINKVTVATP
ncbi:MAG: peptidylprolyl isomerase [Chloroflexota bacterium]